MQKLPQIHRVYRFGHETCDFKWKICCPKDGSQLTFTMACIVISDSPKIEMCIDLFQIGSRPHLQHIILTFLIKESIQPADIDK